MEEYSYTSTHPLGHTGPVTGSLYLFIFKYVPNARYAQSQGMAYFLSLVTSSFNKQEEN